MGLQVCLCAADLLDESKGSRSYFSRGLEHKGDHGCGWEREGVFDSAVVVSFGCLHCFSGCIPFVLETSGRLGPSALGFIQRISGAHTYLRSQLLKEITFICAIYSGRMLEATREWMRVNPHKWSA